jgi:hypothetical protein
MLPASLVPLVLSVLFLSGCASTMKVEKYYDDGKYAAK